MPDFSGLQSIVEFQESLWHMWFILLITIGILSILSSELIFTVADRSTHARPTINGRWSCISSSATSARASGSRSGYAGCTMSSPDARMLWPARSLRLVARS